jgi:hypothetical protein
VWGVQAAISEITDIEERTERGNSVDQWEFSIIKTMGIIEAVEMM